MTDILPVNTFQRNTEPSFPDNDALPKKGEDEKKFDKRFNDWYEDLRINLDRVQDQLTIFFQKDLADGLRTQGDSTNLAISNLDSSVTNTILETNQTLEATNQILQSVRDNLYSV
jgi:hypothetical protein